MADFNGIRKGNVTYDTKDATARNSISVIEGLIPSDASAQNQLATKSDMQDIGLTVVNGQICVAYES